MDRTLAIVGAVCTALGAVGGAAVAGFFKWRIFSAQRASDDERYKALESRLDKAERALARCHRREVSNVRIRARLEAKLLTMQEQLTALRGEVFAVAQQQQPPSPQVRSDEKQ